MSKSSCIFWICIVLVKPKETDLGFSLYKGNQKILNLKSQGHHIIRFLLYKRILNLIFIVQKILNLILIVQKILNLKVNDFYCTCEMGFVLY